jgi:hypothetical protein
MDLEQARSVLGAVEKIMREGNANLRAIAAAVGLEVAIAEAEERAGECTVEAADPLFRLRTARWAMADDDLATLVPVRDPQLQMLTFDVTDLAGGRGDAPAQRIRHIAAFAQRSGQRREPLFVSAEVARIVELSDGTRTVLQIAAQVGPHHSDAEIRNWLRQIEELFLSGLLWLREPPVDQAQTGRHRAAASG